MSRQTRGVRATVMHARAVNVTGTLCGASCGPRRGTYHYVTAASNGRNGVTCEECLTALGPAPREYELTKARVHGAKAILQRRADRVRQMAEHAQAEGHVQFAASLRGKAKAYQEGAALLDALENDRALPPRRRENRAPGTTPADQTVSGGHR